MLSSNFSPFFKKKLSISHLKIVIVWIWWKEIQIILSMMYFKKKQNFLFIIIISNRKIIRNLMQHFFFPFSMVFWVLAYISSLPPNASATAMYQFRFDQKKNTQILLTIHTCIWKRYIVLTSSKPKYRIWFACYYIKERKKNQQEILL